MLGGTGVRRRFAAGTASEDPACTALPVAFPFRSRADTAGLDGDGFSAAAGFDPAGADFLAVLAAGTEDALLAADGFPADVLTADLRDAALADGFLTADVFAADVLTAAFTDGAFAADFLPADALPAAFFDAGFLTACVVPLADARPVDFFAAALRAAGAEEPPFATGFLFAGVAFPATFFAAFFADAGRFAPADVLLAAALRDVVTFAGLPDALVAFAGALAIDASPGVAESAPPDSR